MEKFTTLTAVACPLPLDNVDTDQLIPARFMSRPRAAGYGAFLLHDLRFDAGGNPRADFVLNAPRHAGARILIAGRNFGSGSSREAAVYALADYGIRCVIAPSFGGIFEANAVQNGVLPAIVDEGARARLSAFLESVAAPVLTVDLDGQAIRFGDEAIVFAIDSVRRLKLLNGWDDLDFTDRHRAAIAAYRTQRVKDAPWAFPGGDGGAQ